MITLPVSHICKQPIRKTRFNVFQSDRICESLLGMEYMLGGRGPDVIDCMGIVIFFMREFGIEIPNSTKIGDWEQHSKGFNFLSKLFRKLELEEEFELGDILVFQHRWDPLRVGHQGIFLGGGEIVYAGFGPSNSFMQETGIFFEHLYENGGPWKGRPYAGFRLRE